MSDYTLDLGIKGLFDFGKASKITIIKEVNNADTVIAEFKTDKAKFNKIENGNLIIEIDGKYYKVLGIEDCKEGDKKCQQKAE